MPASYSSPLEDPFDKDRLQEDGAYYQQFESFVDRVASRRPRPDGIENEDVCQEVFVRVCASPPDAGEMSTKGYIVRLVDCVLADAWRIISAKKRGGLGCQHASLEDLFVASGGPSPYDVASAREALAIVECDLTYLPTREQDAVRMRAEGCEYGEIATSVGVSQASARQLVHRGRRRLIGA